MTQSLFAHLDIAVPYAVLIGILAGALAGFVHFTTLKWNTTYFAGGLFGKAFALQSARFAVLVIILALTARLSWPALVAATVSLTLVRMLIVRRERRAAASEENPSPTPSHEGEGLGQRIDPASSQRFSLLRGRDAAPTEPQVNSSPLWGGVGERASWRRTSPTADSSSAEREAK